MGKPDDKVIELGPHERMSVEECLAVVGRENPDRVLILYEDDEGCFVTRSSEMSRKDALWLLECARIHTLEDEE